MECTARSAITRVSDLSSARRTPSTTSTKWTTPHTQRSLSAAFRPYLLTWVGGGQQLTGDMLIWLTLRATAQDPPSSRDPRVQTVASDYILETLSGCDRSIGDHCSPAHGRDGFHAGEWMGVCLTLFLFLLLSGASRSETFKRGFFAALSPDAECLLKAAILRRERKERYDSVGPKVTTLQPEGGATGNKGRRKFPFRLPPVRDRNFPGIGLLIIAISVSITRLMRAISTSHPRCSLSLSSMSMPPSPSAPGIFRFANLCPRIPLSGASATIRSPAWCIPLP